MELDNYEKKWLEGALTTEERKVFEHSDEYQKLSKLSGATLFFKAPAYDVESELGRLKVRRLPKAKVVSMGWLKPLLQVAAAVLLVVSGYFFFKPNLTTVETLAMEKTELRLPDASLVMLNADTKVAYNEKNWSTNREISLDGEAYFKVAKGSKFNIETASGTVSVLGTQFNIKVRPNYFEVVCYEGLVSVRSEGKSVKLPANALIRITDGNISQGNIVDVTAPSWTNNESSFRSVPFSEVISELERQYGVEVAADHVDLKQIFTGKFTHSDLDLALKAISIPLNLKYSITDNKSIILFK